MVKKRLIPCLDVAGGRVVKGVRFEALREVGDPVELATRYSELGADELVFLDITATVEGRGPMLELVERAAAELEIPSQSAAASPGSKTPAPCSVPARTRSQSTGRPSTTRAPDRARRRVRRRRRSSAQSTRAAARWSRTAAGGRAASTLSTGRRRRRARGRRAPAHLDRRGRHPRGYDLELTRAVAQAVAVPVIASGGAGTAAPRGGVRGGRGGGAGRLDRPRGPERMPA